MTNVDMTLFVKMGEVLNPRLNHCQLVFGGMR